MHTTLGILSGARAGESERYSQRTITVGRDAGSDLRFDPEVDLAVSARHAVLFLENGEWRIRDLDSRNGTLVNGRPVDGETRLRHGDRITFGSGGPSVELGLSAEHRSAAPPAAAPRSVRRGAMLALAGGVGLVAVGAGLAGMWQRAEWSRERDAMRLQIDSLQGAGTRMVASLEQQLRDLTTSFERSQAQVRALRSALAEAEANGQPERAEGLRSELRAADQSLRSQQRVAALDFQTIQQGNRHAVARVFVESAQGGVATGTAFAVRADATLVTSRHVVLGESGREAPKRIAVQFSDSEQVWPARLVGVARDADLAIVKVDNILGEVPAVKRLNLRADTLALGSAVAMIGFSDGGAAPDREQGGLARPVLSAGVIREMTPERLEIEGYGAAGGSGSPILDSTGGVIGVAFGGRRSATGQSVYGVPAAAVVRLLGALP